MRMLAYTLLFLEASGLAALALAVAAVSSGLNMPAGWNGLATTAYAFEWLIALGVITVIMALVGLFVGLYGAGASADATVTRLLRRTSEGLLLFGALLAAFIVLKMLPFSS